ncbi:potassium/sodium hyperpolarization-activated cyclic nucleotide-gated channel 2-like [Pectinophora gossypiella]|uniref:potassium/sodium hyperpolarization-activated cyclic nucleotide-gated channel 2-like n=1 Tax=Pectinophora gossypiella TaxID=13191 RepID=UPI00214E2CAD|nr:potassium/sodium hyperpolarization-activated cyclic nucleotide-gated channel 2-like [Pectinophora gossypiella]
MTGLAIAMLSIDYLLLTDSGVSIGTTTKILAEEACLCFKFGLIWSTAMVLFNLLYIIVAPLRFSYILPTEPPEHADLDHVILALQIVCFFDIILKLNIGYLDKNDKHIVLSRSRIACRYFCRWFLIDLASCLPLAYTIPWISLGLRHQMFFRLLPCIRCARLFTILNDFKVFTQIFKMSYIWQRCSRHSLMFAVSMHWCSCVLYLAPLFHFYWLGKKPEGYCLFLVQQRGDLTLCSASFRYQKAIFVSCAAFFGTGYSMFKSTFAVEIVLNACVILYGSGFMVYTLVLLLKIYVTKFKSTMRYQELMNQVEKYMRHKQFPLQMKTRVRDFYNYRYQERYFLEDIALDCLSEQLRNEITLDTCHKLIDKVSLFDGLPASVVGAVLGCLKPAVYMPNDLVVRAGDIGLCMYFIASGTVAVYSLKGAEVCHLDDGAHFGEVALLMKDRKRVATVVAIEITQVYCLEASDFRDFVMTYQELYERVEMLASKRMHETVLIDEAYKQRHPF